MDKESLILKALVQILENQIALSDQCLHSNPSPYIGKQSTLKLVKEIENEIK